MGGTNQTEIVSMKLDVSQPAQRPEGVRHERRVQYSHALCDHDGTCSCLHEIDSGACVICSYRPHLATGTSSRSPLVTWRCAALACCQSGMCDIIIGCAHPSPLLILDSCAVCLAGCEQRLHMTRGRSACIVAHMPSLSYAIRHHGSGTAQCWCLKSALRTFDSLSPQRAGTVNYKWDACHTHGAAPASEQDLVLGLLLGRIL